MLAELVFGGARVETGIQRQGKGRVNRGDNERPDPCQIIARQEEQYEGAGQRQEDQGAQQWVAALV